MYFTIVKHRYFILQTNIPPNLVGADGNPPLNIISPRNATSYCGLIYVSSKVSAMVAIGSTVPAARGME